MSTKKDVDYLLLPRDGHLNIRVPLRWKADAEAEWKRAQKAPGGEKFRTFTDYVIWTLRPKGNV